MLWGVIIYFLLYFHSIYHFFFIKEEQQLLKLEKVIRTRPLKRYLAVEIHLATFLNGQFISPRIAILNRRLSEKSKDKNQISKHASFLFPLQ